VISAVVGIGLAVFAFLSLRERATAPSPGEPDVVEPTEIGKPVPVPVAKPARECF
jgi:hypothetical protein